MSVAEASRIDLLRMEKLLEMQKYRYIFATKHHLTTKGEPLDFINAPHIVELYNAFAPEIVIQGSVQSFKSEWAVVDHLAAAYSGLQVFYVLPKYESRNTFVQNRVNRCVSTVKEYKKIVGEGFFDNVVLKSFGRGVIKYVGSNVLTDFKEFPADILYIDELDECDSDNVDYGIDRLRASIYQFKRYIANPRYAHKDKGINAKYMLSDQREWTVPCLYCGAYSELDWFNTVVDPVYNDDGNVIRYTLRDKKWEIGCGRDVYPICPKCGTGHLDRTSSKGAWVAKNPMSPILGYHFSMLYSPLNSIGELWGLFQKAILDPSALTRFYNSNLGLPVKGMGSKLTDEVLYKCAEKDYYFIHEPLFSCNGEKGHAGPCTMGVDVGGLFDVRISCRGDKGERKAVFIGKVSSTSELHDLIRRYNVEKVVMDSMPETNLVKEFQQEAACDVWLCRYSGTDGNYKKVGFDPSSRVISIDRTNLLDKALSVIRAGKNKIPENYKHILSGDYVREMTVSVRELVEDRRGNIRYEWSKGEDHQRHADAYDLLAKDLLDASTIDSIQIL